MQLGTLLAIGAVWAWSSHPAVWQEVARWRDPSPHTVRFVTVEPGVNLEVLDWGGTGRPVVLLAGYNTAHIYDDLASRLAEFCHVYGITRRGMGASSAPDTGYSAQRSAEDILQVLDELKILKPVLVGHSFGGQDLNVIGAQHPEQVAGLVYLNSGEDATLGPAIWARIGIDPEEIEALRNPEECTQGKGELSMRAEGILAKTCIITVAVVAAAFAATVAYAQKPPAAKPAECAALEQDLFIDLKEVVKAGCTPSPAQISKLLENPVANFVSIPFQYDYITVEGPRMGDAKALHRFQVTPMFPTPLGKNWSLINRVVFPVIGVPFNKGFGDCIGMAWNEIRSCPSFPGALQDPFDYTSGFGDMVYVGVVAPKESIKIESTGGVFVWGVGATAMLPTASDEVLGTGRFSPGPTGVVAYLGRTWTAAIFPQHWWSVGGNGNRSDVNLTNIQYFIFYAPPGLDPNAAWRIGLSPNISINWEAPGDKVTLPLGLGAGRMVSIGALPVNIHGEVDYSVIRPGDKPGSRWDVRIYITAVIPTFVF